MLKKSKQNKNQGKENIDLTHSSVTSTSPASEYWGVDLSVVYGKSHTIFSETAGIVDTCTYCVFLNRIYS